jgi:predicted DNA-binding transcriptional regulator AlpA
MQQYLTLSDLRAKLGNRSRSAIYNDLACNRLPRPLKLGGKLYWPSELVDAHIAALRDRAG